MPVVRMADSTAGLTAMMLRLAAARRAYARDRPAELRLDAGKMMSQAYLLKLSATLPLNEVSVILAADGIREQALTLIHAGEMTEGTRLLHRAAVLGDAPMLSDHARIAARSFQRAAEAFLAYRQGRHNDAIRDLAIAIAACDDLADHFDDVMEFRRIHLARNILRCRCRGAPSERVVADSINLLFYIGGDRARWPLAVGRNRGDPGRLSRAQRASAIDETIVNLALDSVDIGSAHHALPRSADRQRLEVDLIASLAWCDALIAHRVRDRRGFARHATSFFDRRHDLVQAGRILDAIIDEDGSAR